MGWSQPRRINHAEPVLHGNRAVPVPVWLDLKLTVQEWMYSLLPQLTFSAGSKSTPNLLFVFLSVNFHVFCSCLGPVLCLIKQRKLMRYEVTWCHMVDRIQCAQREVSEGSGQRVKWDLTVRGGSLGSGHRSSGQDGIRLGAGVVPQALRCGSYLESLNGFSAVLWTRITHKAPKMLAPGPCPRPVTWNLSRM